MSTKQEVYELTLGIWDMRRLYDYSGPMGEIFHKKESRYKILGSYNDVRKVIVDSGNEYRATINGVPAFAL